MRKFVLLLLALAFLPVLAMAEDVMPPEVQAMIDEYYGQRLPAEYVEIVTEDGRREGIAVIEGGSVLGFENAAGRWEMTLQCFVMDELRPAYAEHVAGDELAIAITSADNTTRLTYRYDGTEFRLVGWVIPGYRPVTVKGDTLTYGEGENAFTTVLPGGVNDWPYWADELPLSPEDALARAAISEQSIRSMFPGYTLLEYSAFNDGTMADAAYFRVTDGVLHLRRVGLKAGEDARVADAMPVRLSEALLIRLETEPVADLLCGWATSETFLTQDAFDRAVYPLPEDAVILQSRIETDSLVVLAEVDGVRRVYVYETGAPVRMTQPLPEDVYLDFFHTGDGALQFEWAQQNMTACFVRREDGCWRLSWCTCYGPSMDIHFSACAFGVWEADEKADLRLRVGTLTDCDLFSVNLSDLDGAQPVLDRSGWAVVNNPDPADRLHLRTKADRSAHSMGKFYNGTPVRVLSRKGDWTQVQIGFGDTARTGWMMTKYLAFGSAMDSVADAFPDLTFREEYSDEERRIGYGYMVVGVKEDGSPKQYILLGDDGQVTYVPQSWLWGGNG